MRTTDLRLGKYSIAEPHPLPESGRRETKEKGEGMKGEGRSIIIAIRKAHEHNVFNNITKKLNMRQAINNRKTRQLGLFLKPDLRPSEVALI